MSTVTVNLFISTTDLIVSINDTKSGGNAVNQMFELTTEEISILDSQITEVWEQS